jgi:hypothetical protein
VWLLGAAPNSTGQAQNIFERVFNCTCTSSPIVATYFISDFGNRIAESYFRTRAVFIELTTIAMI